MAEGIYRGESTVVLHTAKHDRPTVIPLHGLDTMAVPIHIEIRHFFHPPKDSLHNVIKNLKSSLAEALEIYFPVAGTVVVNEKAESLIAIDQANIRGAPFIVEIKDFPFKQETEELSPRGATFLPPSSPTFAVKLSKFSCGTLIMAASIHHQVTDLRGYLDFVEIWATLARGQAIDFSKVPTDWSRTPMKYFDGLYTQAGVTSPPPGYSVLPSPPTDLPSFAASEITYWNFTKQDIEKLKNEFSPSNESASDLWISSGDALASLCWGAVARARKDGGIPRSPMSDPQNDRLAMAADGRDRAPRGDMLGAYYGNFNLLITFLAPRDDLLLPTSEAGSRIALIIRQAIHDQLNPKSIAHKIAFYEGTEDTSRIIWFGDVIMTNWCKFDLSGPNVDFGWGKPFRTTAGGDVYPPGYVRILQDKGSGDVQVLVTIEAPAAKYLKADPLLRRYGVV